MTQKDYADAWAVSSKKYFDHGIYSWMENFVRDHQNVAEIGCGVGYSTLTLLQKGHKVLVVEKNNVCVDATQELLTKNKYRVKLVLNDKDCPSDFNDYDVIILNVNIRDYDPSALCELGRYFDILDINAVLLWLLGGFSSVDENVSDARVDLENKVFFLASRLDKKAFESIHYVERATEETLSATVCDFRLIVDDFKEFRFSDPATYEYDYNVLGGMPMMQKEATKGDNSKNLLVSMIYTPVK